MTERYDCHYCKESLFGKKYVLREENPYCVKCYESLYSNTCEDCKKPIGCNSRVSCAYSNMMKPSRSTNPDMFLCCSRRICPTRTATGMRTVSSVSSASALWWTSPSPPRMSSSSVLSATPMSTPPSATSARKP